MSCDAAEAFARDLFQAGGIEHRDVSVTVTDQTRLLQRARRRCHPGSPYRQHHREKFLRERQLIGADPVSGALYVAGQNDGFALARGKYLHLVHRRDPFGAEAMSAGRYALPEFGLGKGTERTLRAWQAAQGRGKSLRRINSRR